MPELEIRAATEDDVPLILSLVKELSEYERLSHQVVATEEVLRASLFGERRVAEVLIGHHGGEPAGFALFFHNFSTFLGRPGIYLEDLYVSQDTGVWGSVRRSWRALRSWPKSAAAAGSNGGFWTGTSPR